MHHARRGPCLALVDCQRLTLAQHALVVQPARVRDGGRVVVIGPGVSDLQCAVALGIRLAERLVAVAFAQRPAVQRGQAFTDGEPIEKMLAAFVSPVGLGGTCERGFLAAEQPLFRLG